MSNIELLHTKRGFFVQKKIAQILEYLQDCHVDYADVRIVRTIEERIATENLQVQQLETDHTYGYGIRVFVEGALGFASSQDFDHMERTAAQAIEIAQASAMAQREPVVLSPKPVIIDRYASPYQVDPFTVSKKDKIDLLFAAETKMREGGTLFRTTGFLRFSKEEKIFADTEGSYIEQTIVESGGGIQAFAADQSGMQVRSYPNSSRGNYATAGYEYIESLDFIKHAQETGREAAALLSAEVCPSGVYDLIIGGTQLYLQIHESVGHPTELDRVLGYEAGYAGTSFLNPEMINDFRYGSEHVNIVADATVPGGLGTFGYDDEGVPAQYTELITKGIFQGFTTSRDTAPVIGQKSNGTARAVGWGRIPIVRMTNINLLPGEFTLEQLIERVDDGLFLKTNKSWSIDDRRLNFQFATEIAYEIKEGKLTGKIYKNPIYSGITPQFWNSCAGVANRDYWVMYGTPNCGKGEPPQVAHVGHGCAPALFRQVKVGVEDVK